MHIQSTMTKVYRISVSGYSYPVTKWREHRDCRLIIISPHILADTVWADVCKVDVKMMIFMIKKTCIKVLKKMLKGPPWLNLCYVRYQMRSYNLWLLLVMLQRKLTEIKINSNFKHGSFVSPIVQGQLFLYHRSDLFIIFLLMFLSSGWVSY